MGNERLFSILLSISACASIAVVLAPEKSILLFLLIALTLVFWLVGLWSQKAPATLLAFTGTTLLAGYAIISGYSPELPALSLILSLSSWALDNFIQHIDIPENVRNRDARIRNYLISLLVLSSISGLLVFTAQRIRMTLSFGVALAIATILIITISSAVRSLRR